MSGSDRPHPPGKIGKDDTVVFVHTGGNPALFAYNQQLMS